MGYRLRYGLFCDFPVSGLSLLRVADMNATQANENPGSDVLGTDLSPIQPE